jgi:hypothetical protein
MIQQDYILLILNCVKYRYKALKQQDTWLRDIPSSLLYFHVIGDPQLKTAFFFAYDEHILYVNCDDDYNSLPRKIMWAFRAIESIYNYKYIFKTDDDQILIKNSFFDTLIKVLNNKNPPVNYGGNIVNVTQPHISQYYRVHPELPTNIIIQPIRYCNGRFYFLSRDAVEYLLKQKKLIDQTYLEDYAIGFHLHSFFKENMMHIKTNEIFIDLP